MTVQQAFQLALQHHQAGRLAEAEALYRQILAVDPRHADALHLLGVAAAQAGRHDVAVELMTKAVALKPNYPQAHTNLGNALSETGRLDEAIASYRRAIALKPDFSEGHSNLGNALRDQGQLDEAIAAYRQAIVLEPNFPGVHYNLGIALKDQGKLDEAIAAYRQAIALKPNYPKAHSNLGIALRDQGQLEQAVAAYRQAIALDPDLPEVHNNLGNALRDQGRLDEAIASYRQAIALDPNVPQGHNNLGNAFKDKGQLDEALAAYRRALQIRPDHPEAHSNLLLALHCHPGFDARAIDEEHDHWNQQHAEPLRRFIQPHLNDRMPDRRLRIGYVSPDFRAHPVGRFLLPLLAEHDHQDFEIFCYAQVLVPDDLTRRLRAHADHWHSLVELSNPQAAELIRQHRIDILVDLALHTGRNRLVVFAQKPAPVQVTYLGYPGSSGLRTMDYRLSDPFLDPSEVDESVYSEQTFRLAESCWCYQPMETPPLPPMPALAAGYITFGCLNNFCKVNERVLALWARILGQVEGSRLLLLSPEGSHRGDTMAVLRQLGVEDSRVELVARKPWREYLELYHRIDISLDTFPFNGHTTTCDALWMGVPVVTLAGNTAVGRAGLSVLSNIGLPELVADSEEEYVRIAIKLATDLSRLDNLRVTLRQRMKASVLMDAPRYARQIETAYRTMWRRWCMEKPPLADMTIQQALEVAIQHHQSGRLAEAEALYRQILAVDPRHADALHLLGVAAAQSGRHDVAVELMTKAVSLKPNYPQAHTNLGNALSEKGRLDEAIASYRRAITLKPNYPEAYSNLGKPLMDQGQLDDAIAAYRRAIALKPNLPEAHNNLGNALREKGQLDDAFAAYRQAIALNPNYPEAHSNLIYTLQFHPSHDTVSIREEHGRWNRQFAESLRRIPRDYPSAPDPERRLRIGYISPDFRDHVVGRNVLPVLERHDRAQFEVFLYANGLKSDALSRRFERAASVWRNITGSSDEAVAELIRADQIDVLIELSLHMAGNRLLVLARKSAPVQVTWAGYPGTTGLEAIDYRLTDPYLDPPGSSDEYYSEKSIRLPHSFWCFDPLTPCPPVEPLPALSAGHITFGSLNNYCKVNPGVLELWAKVLGAVKDSHLLLLSKQGAHRQHALEVFQQHGVAADRIEWFTPAAREQYLEAYHRIDLGLDTFPYNGHTTSLESFWMGVPVITLVGTTVVGRAGLSQAMNLGLPELVARTAEEYLKLAADFAADLPRLAELRQSLRSRMEASPLMDAAGFTRDLEAGYRAMWRQWCAERPT